MAISNAVPQSAVASVLGIKTNFVDLRKGNIVFKPQMIAIFGQGSSASTYSNDKKQITSSAEAGSTYGFGSPVHLAAQQLFPTNGDGVGTIPVTIFPLQDDASGVAASGDITPSGVQTKNASYNVKINNILSQSFVIGSTDTVATIVTKMTNAINANIDMPVVATDNTTVCDLAAKWKGISGNDIFIEIVESSDAGTIFTITQPNGGLVNPKVDSALLLMGDEWDSLCINCLDSADTIAMDAYSTFNDGRWGALTHKPLVVLTGNNIVDPTTASAVSAARSEFDKTNGFACAPGSKNLPLQIASRSIARIAVIADSNPARSYQSARLSGITPGIDSEQWNYAQRDLAVKRGCSTIEVVDGVIKLGDMVTFWAPAAEVIPAYRYIVTIVKLQNMIFNTAIIFEQDTWKGAPLIPDNQATVESTAKKPKMAKAEIAAMIDILALYAIISDPDTAKASIIAVINDMNPNRLDLKWTTQVSGNTNITSIDNDFGFFFGQPVILN